jgi:Fic family protein
MPLNPPGDSIVDRSKFSDRKTGELVEIAAPYGDLAFVPDPLPPVWEMPESVWRELAEARQLLGELDGLGRALPSPGLMLRPLQQREALRSSSLEGTYASPEELLLFELRPRLPVSRNDPANAWLEVSNYGTALREGYESLREGRPLSLTLIRQLHAWLLKGVRGEDRGPGEFRETQVHVGSDRRFVPPPPEHLRSSLDALQTHLAAGEIKGFDPLVSCYLLHYQFEAIHPFRDGNGRVGRLLLALMTWLWCRLSLPWLYMSPYFERYKDEYIDTLFRVSTDARWEEWIGFCLRGTIQQARDGIRRCSALINLRRQLRASLAEGSIRLSQVIDQLFARPAVTIPDLARTYDVTYPTAKTDVDRLVRAAVLKHVPNTNYPKVFLCSQILEIAYGEPAD